MFAPAHLYPGDSTKACKTAPFRAELRPAFPQ